AAASIGYEQSARTFIRSCSRANAFAFVPPALQQLFIKSAITCAADACEIETRGGARTTARGQVWIMKQRRDLCERAQVACFVELAEQHADAIRLDQFVQVADARVADDGQAPRQILGHLRG